MSATNGRTIFRRLLPGFLWGTLLQGLLVFGGLPLGAAPTDSLSFTVSIVDADPPTAIADVSASSTVTPGQAVLTWTAPDEDAVGLNGEAAQSYLVKYATFSIASLGGNSALWWTLASTAPFPPVPQTPGNGEIMVVNLASTTRYYFGVRSLDPTGNLSPIDTTAPQATVLTGPTDFQIPAPVSGVTLVNNTGLYTMTWSSTTVNTDGTPATDIVGYEIYSSTDLFGSFGLVVSTPGIGGGFSFTPDPINDVFYVIRAVDNSGNRSPLIDSNFLHVTPTAILGLVGKSTDGSMTRAYVPEGLIPEVKAGGDLLIGMSVNSQPAYNRDAARTLGTYNLTFSGPGAAANADFAMSRPNMNVTLQYAANAGANASNIGVLWWNGSAWVKLGIDPSNVDETLRTVRFDTGLPGIYQVRFYQKADGLSLDRAAVFPRVFSPNGDDVNDRVFFALDNPKGSSFTGKILDLSGGWVADLQAAGAGAPSPDALAWDGRDKTGHIVPAGVYIYKIEGEGRTFTGTVVVAQ